MRIVGFAVVAALAGLLSASPVSSASADILINVDKSQQRMTVLVNGYQRWSWPVSTGVPAHETPSGNFKTFRMEKDHFSKEWDDAPMPNSIFFTMKGHAIHGSFDVKRLGRPASHGCVRLAPENAAQLFTLVKEEGLSNTRVVLSGEAGFPSEYGPRGKQPNFFEAIFNQQQSYAEPPPESRRRRTRDRW
jgi:lipoprotein-anchoring transpeptidase ErfK/SrfK